MYLIHFEKSSLVRIYIYSFDHRSFSVNMILFRNLFKLCIKMPNYIAGCIQYLFSTGWTVGGGTRLSGVFPVNYDNLVGIFDILF